MDNSSDKNWFRLSGLEHCLLMKRKNTQFLSLGKHPKVFFYFFLLIYCLREELKEKVSFSFKVLLVFIFPISKIEVFIVFSLGPEKMVCNFSFFNKMTFFAYCLFSPFVFIFYFS